MENLFVRISSMCSFSIPHFLMYLITSQKQTPPHTHNIRGKWWKRVNLIRVFRHMKDNWVLRLYTCSIKVHKTTSYQSIVLGSFQFPRPFLLSNWKIEHEELGLFFNCLTRFGAVELFTKNKREPISILSIKHKLFIHIEGITIIEFLNQNWNKSKIKT